MRGVLAAVLALSVLLCAAEPHVHLGGGGEEVCAECMARLGDVPRSETPDVAPRTVTASEPAEPAGLPPATGAPLGAIPGQSPPAGA